MKGKVLVTRAVPEVAIERLAAECVLEVNREERILARDELLERVKGIDALLCLLTDKVDGQVMDAAGKSLKVIANYAVGYDNIDVPAATARKIPVTNTPGVLTDATADLTWALILDAVRRVSEGDRVMRREAFPGWSPLYMLGGEVSGATLGLFGFGRIGQAVAKRAKGFGMRVIYHQRRRADATTERELGAEYCGFEELLAQADIVSIHAPLTPETKGRFTLKEMSRMKRTACLINTSRGPIVSEPDLAKGLSEGLIAAAGLDVYEFEPKAEPGLLGQERAVLAPHLGSATLATRTKMANIAVDNILSVLSGSSPVSCVNLEVL